MRGHFTRGTGRSVSSYCNYCNVFPLFETADLNGHKLWNMVILHLNFLKTALM